MGKIEFLIGKGYIDGHAEETECDYCREALWDGDSTRDVYSCSLDESDMIARFCCKSCAVGYIEKLEALQ